MKHKIKINACAICALQHGEHLISKQTCHLDNRHTCDVCTKEEIHNLCALYPNSTKESLAVLLQEIALHHYEIIED